MPRASKSVKSGVKSSAKPDAKKPGVKKLKPGKSARATIRRNRTKKRKAAGKPKPKHTRPFVATEIPRHNKVAKNLYDLLGGREGVLDLVRDIPQSPDNSKLNALRDVLLSDDLFATDRLGRVKTSFGTALNMTGVTERDVWQLFLDRRRAETVVTLADAEPRIAGEVIDAALSKLVPCRQCSATKVVYTEDGEGNVKSQACRACDRNGMQIEEGSFKHQELFFDLTKLKQIPATQINTNVTNDNRSINFQAGQPGSAPTPLSMIKSLDRIRDQGPRPAAVAMLNPVSDVPDVMLPGVASGVKDAEVVGD